MNPVYRSFQHITSIMNEDFQTNYNLKLRILAALIDYLFVLAFTMAYLYVFGEPNDEGGYSVNGLPAFAPILFWGIVTIGLEQWIGASFGNSILRLKPISIKGYNRDLTLGQSLRRHILSPIDMSFFGIVGIIAIKNTAKNQRLGDIWANTIVIRNND